MTSVLQCYRPHSLKWIYVLDEDFEWQSPYGFGTKGMAFTIKMANDDWNFFLEVVFVS